MKPPSAAWKIALVYAVLGTVWILVSDTIVDWFFADRPGLVLAQTVKGLLFIGASTALVYGLARWARAGPERQRDWYHDLFDLGPDAVFLIGGEGLFVEVNNMAVERYGYGREELLRMGLGDLASPDSGDAAEEHVARARKGFVRFDARHVTRNEGGIEVEIAARPVRRDGKGYVLAAVRDVSSVRRAEEALRQSEQRFRTVVESAPEAIFVQTNERFAYLNRACVRLLGAESDDVLLGRPILERFHPDDHDGIRERIRALNEDRRPVDQVEESLVTLDGERIPAEVAAAPIEYGGDPGAVVFLRDIRDRKRHEAEQRRLTRAIEQTGEAIVVTDVDGAIRYVNAAFEEIAGYAFEETMDLTIDALRDADQDEGVLGEIADLLAAGRTWSGRIVNQRKDGTPYTADASISPVRGSSGAIVEHVEVQRDVTREAELERQLRQAQRMESVGRLAGGLAHDINNMLTVVVGHAEMALDETGRDDPRHEHLDAIRLSVERSTKLVRQLLSFAREQVIDPRVLDLNAAVERRLDMLSRLIGENLRLVWRPDPDLDPVKLDPGQLDQLLTNLVVNARDAIGDVGTVTIETGLAEFDEEYCADHVGFVPGRYALLAVADTGVGMDSETLDHLFEPFFTTKPEGRGTGLGLSTVYGVVRQHEGFVNVYSEPGEGTTFRIYLPFARETEPARPEEREVSLNPTGRETILLVEDERSLLELATRQLESLGYTVLASDDPGEAIRKAERHEGTIDLLLTDVVMPGMNGLDLYHELLERRPGLPALFMSGYTAGHIVDRDVLDEEVSFLPKPFGLRDLSVKVREALDDDSS